MAFETAFAEEGGYPVFLSIQDIQLGSKNRLKILQECLVEWLMLSNSEDSKQETVETLAKYSGVPVYNGLTDLFPTTQVSADLQTIEEEVWNVETHKDGIYGRW